MKKNSLLRAFVLLFAFTLVAAACGSDDETTTDSEDETTDSSADDSPDDDADADADAGDESSGDAEAGGDLSGEIVISGSSTVEPISIDVAEAYKAANGDSVNVSVSGPGTGDGFKAFCAGETEISDASRQIKDEEAADCTEAGINYVELKVAVDGIAVMTSAENEAVSCLSFAELYALVGPESAGFGKWSDGNELDTALGGEGAMPDAELVISAPGTESGTYDSFIEIAIEDLAEAQGQDATVRPDYSSAADDNVIIETISTNPTSFGWVGFAYAVEADGVKLLEISEEPGGTCVAPTPETIASNEYPIARDLFIYVNTDAAAESEALVDFVDYYMDYGLNEAVAQVGYVPLTDDAKAETVAAWEGR